MSEVSTFEQTIYNTWLRTIRRRANQPYRNRTRWDNLDPTIRLCLTRLATFFGRYNHIDIECFFNAPYEVYVNDVNNSYPLVFFTTHKAVSLYTSYLKMLRMLAPDHPASIQWIKRSFAYIGRHCIKNNISLTNYGSGSRDRAVPLFLRDVKDGYITIYAMFAFPSALSSMQALEPDVRQLMLGDIDIHQFYRDYLESKQAKSIAEQSYSVLDKYLQKPIQSTENNR